MFPVMGILHSCMIDFRRQAINMHCSRNLILSSISVLSLTALCSSNDVPKHYCGSSLTDALFSICKNHGFATHFTPRSAKVNRFRLGGIIEECCNNPCSKSHLSQYCDKKLARASLLVSEERTKDSNHQTFRFTNQVTKRKRSPSCSCGNRIFKKKNRKQSMKRPKMDKKTYRLEDPRLSGPTTTEKQTQAEAQYIDDWVGEDLVFLNNH